MTTKEQRHQAFLARRRDEVDWEDVLDGYCFAEVSPKGIVLHPAGAQIRPIERISHAEEPEVYDRVLRILKRPQPVDWKPYRSSVNDAIQRYHSPC